MKVTSLVLNEHGEPHYREEAHYNVDGLIKVAAAKENIAREAGADKMVDIVTSFGKAYVNVVNTGEDADIDKALMELIVTLWLLDTVHFGISVDAMRDSDFDLTITDDGIVKYTRVPVGANGTHRPSAHAQ